MFLSASTRLCIESDVALTDGDRFMERAKRKQTRPGRTRLPSAHPHGNPVSIGQVPLKLRKCYGWSTRTADDEPMGSVSYSRPVSS